MCLYVVGARITIETGSVESVCIICRMDVVARVDRRFDSSTILQLSSFFDADRMAVLKAVVSLYRAGEKKPIEDISPGLKSRNRINYFRLSKKISSSFLGLTSKLRSSAWRHLT